jgi:hypothetical protein
MEIRVIKKGCCAAEYPKDFHVLILYPLRCTAKELYAMTKGPKGRAFSPPYTLPLSAPPSISSVVQNSDGLCV